MHRQFSCPDLSFRLLKFTWRSSHSLTKLPILLLNLHTSLNLLSHLTIKVDLLCDQILLKELLRGRVQYVDIYTGGLIRLPTSPLGYAIRYQLSEHWLSRIFPSKVHNVKIVDMLFQLSIIVFEVV